MRLLSRFRPSRIPLRLRLSIWYTFALGFILLLFAAFVYFQVRRTLIGQVDAALNLAANQALIGVRETDGRFSFQTAEGGPPALGNLRDDFIIYLLAADETVLDTLSAENEIPDFTGQTAGYDTVTGLGESWRVYRQPFELAGFSGWIQVVQELDPVNAALAGLQAQILAGLPPALLLAGLGGYFLASRALRPIDAITRTAQSISAGDLERRLNYRGPADEVGRLAQTFDSMLNRLQASFARERRFTGEAAHELRTPLTALKGRIGVTLSRPRPAADYQETLVEMEEQVNRLIRLSGDLLFMARLDQGQFLPKRDQIGLADFMGAVVDHVRPPAEAKGIILAEEIPDGAAVVGDMDLLIRLFLNLLDNAVKYTPEYGRVTIQAAAQAGFIRVTIRDTGPGIAAEHLPYLFDRFYRVESDRSRSSQDGRGGGTGLGLAIAHEIVRMHDGRLWVESEVGVGTVFVVEIRGGVNNEL
jgi:heavy metal sensor kinase